MAYTAVVRDHVWVITSDGTAGGFTNFTSGQDNTERWRTIRWIPSAGADTITLDRVKQDGTTETIWESAGGVAGPNVPPQESRLDVRFTLGFKIVMTTGGKLYAYQALDGPIGSK